MAGMRAEIGHQYSQDPKSVVPGLRQDLYRDLLVLLLPGQCKAGRAPFWRVPQKSATWVAQRGSRFFSSGQVSTSFPGLLGLLASDFNTNEFDL